MSDLAELRWMLPPLAMCLVLTGIHGYLGIHVLSRKVIFVDLALAQIAALGSTYAFLLGYDPRLPGDSTVVYLFSLGFTLVGAAVFSLTRMRHEKVPQEAFIGIVYAMASAVALLLLAKATGEAEHIKEMLVGNVLLVTWPTVVRTAVIYVAIGAFHYAFRKPFIEISTDPEGAIGRGRKVRLWDFLFYATFGLVITSSVAVAGVLLVFSFLVAPAVIAFMYQERIGARILVAWTIGTTVSAGGMLLSYYGDLPTGPSVVTSFAGVLVVAALIYAIRVAESRIRATVKVLSGTALVALLFASSLRAGKEETTHAHGSEFEMLARDLASGDESKEIEAIHHLARLKDPHAVGPLVAALEHTGSDRVREHIVEVLPELGDSALDALPALEKMAESSDDPFLRFEASAALLRLKSAIGFERLAGILDDDPPLLLEEKIGQLIEETTGEEFGIGVDENPRRRGAAKQRFRRWLSKKGHRLRWRQDLRRFE